MNHKPLTTYCPKCGEKTSITLDHCEYCGCYLRKMKKPIYRKWWFWVIAVFVVFMIIPTSGGDESEAAEKEETNISEVSKPDSSNKTSTNTNSNEKNEPTKNPTETKTDKGESKATVSIKQQILLDREGVRITAVEYVTDTLLGDGVKILVENNTDQNLRIGCETLIVNNYMINEWFYTNVAAGKKVYDTIKLYSSELNASGIENVGQIELSFYVRDSETYDSVFESDLITITTSMYSTMDTIPNDDGFELYHSEDVRIVGKYVDEDSFWGSSVLLYIENKTDKTIKVSCENMSINDYMVDGYMFTTIYPQKMIIDTITVFSSDLEENGISSIDQIELTFHVVDADTYKTILDTEPIAFSVNK